MKLIVGLGNYTKEYEGTRHNAGFICVDYIASEYNVSFSLEHSLKCMLAKVNVGGEKAILIKPTTFMNLSGEAVIAVSKYYKIDVKDIIIISDDLDSNLGRVRLRDSGSAGGHNGLKNIELHLHTNAYNRIKVGIGRDKNISVIDYVLQKFSPSEREVIDNAKVNVFKACDEFIKGETFYKIASKYSK